MTGGLEPWAKRGFTRPLWSFFSLFLVCEADAQPPDNPAAKNVYLYKDIHFKGYLDNFEGTNSTANFHQSGKGDVISSMKIITKPTADPACD
ncbi:MAG: hypothetical protein WCS47_05060 [Thermovirgaceae bacterium]|jgi:hypothetical protein|nr:hypothetical protein [Synergistales bacterium]MDI9392800.1 hypothetical protein [Synergistota bacterium]MDY0178355.1 hypothetical protein [Synergistaceae bacterium]HRW87581.1 hypothetical protein [Thermovirgaceae bacterium]MDD3133118.1 hypothetical protein [Synergistales bacterium]